MSGAAYVEITIAGAYARVAAIDPETGTEVVVMGPANASRADLERLALAKLARALAAAGDPQPEPSPRPARPGWSV